MNKITILAVASLMSVSSYAFAEEATKPTIAPAATTATANAQKDIKNIKNTAQQKMNDTKQNAQQTANAAKQNAQQNAPKKIGQYNQKGTGSRSLAQFKKMDKDSNGTISQTEFNAANVDRFNKKDKNKDGNVSQAEFSPTLAKIAQQAKN